MRRLKRLLKRLDRFRSWKDKRGGGWKFSPIAKIINPKNDPFYLHRCGGERGRER